MSLLPTMIWLNIPFSPHQHHRRLPPAPQAEHGLQAGVSTTGRGSAKEKNLSPPGQEPVAQRACCGHAARTSSASTGLQHRAVCSWALADLPLPRQLGDAVDGSASCARDLRVWELEAANGVYTGPAARFIEIR